MASGASWGELIGGSSFALDDSGFFEMAFELGIVEVSREVGIAECIVGGEENFIGSLGQVEGVFSGALYPLLVSYHCE